jgi:hypothetical protein
VFKYNVFSGADVNSGLDRGIDLEPTDASYGKGTIGNLSFTIENNTFNSQANTSIDDHAGIEFLCSTASTVTLDVKENTLETPAGIIPPPLGLAIAGMIIVNDGPGLLTAHLHKNVSLTIPPTVGYLFTNRTGSTALFDLDMGYDNFGSSQGP